MSISREIAQNYNEHQIIRQTGDSQDLIAVTNPQSNSNETDAIRRQRSKRRGLILWANNEKDSHEVNDISSSLPIPLFWKKLDLQAIYRRV